MSRDLSEFYVQEYLTESATPLEGADAGQETPPIPEGVEDVVEYDDLEFDLGDELSNETYYAGGDEGDSRNSAKPKIKKGAKKGVKKESFAALYRSIVEENMDEFGGEGEYATDDEMDYDEGDETVSVSASVIRDIISQLEGIVGGGEEEFEDDYAEDGLEDEFPTESWDGGAGDQRMKGNYSGKATGGKESNLNSKGQADTGFKPDDTEGSEGDGKMKGDYSGKAKGGKTSNLHSKGQAKVKGKKTKPEVDLFGTD
jgi:hypothetical protein|tara:strand:- start:13677 stop:14447 length:771 start_codon:yes stop_codon:yes gene_type:complete